MKRVRVTGPHTEIYFDTAHVMGPQSPCGSYMMQHDPSETATYHRRESVPTLIDLLLVVVDALGLVGVGLHQAIGCLIQLLHLSIKRLSK